MEINSYRLLDKKIIINANSKISYTPEELIESGFFEEFLLETLRVLSEKNSPLLNIFPDPKNPSGDIKLLIKTLIYLTKIDGEAIPKILDGAETFFKDKVLFNDFVEFVYNYWREFDRFIICRSNSYEMDKRPYRVFNATIESLSHIIRKVYRDVQENITNDHPSIYRQVVAGAEMAAITSQKYQIQLSDKYNKLNDIPIVRQLLLHPPLILNPPMNKRRGNFTRIEKNPVDVLDFNSDEWLCYPAKVGELLIFVYFHHKFMELGFSLCNLFELASNEDLTKKPDGVYFFGVPGAELDSLAELPAVFHEDDENNILVAAIPNKDEFGYFGYLKKMILTLHNITMIKKQELPFHGALVKITLQDDKVATILLIGDSGAGKSETLEAFRILGDKYIKDIVIIADDMGSVKIDNEGKIKGYGTEIGAFVRLDDLQPGYAFGQIDRTIIMNPSQVNARAILPVTPYSKIMKGSCIDYIFYANNYEGVDTDHPILEKFDSKEEAIKTFREGAVMSKGTTTTSGLVNSYFANIFGPPQYKELHEEIAERFFSEFFDQGIYVGQLRTQLGIPGNETEGPQEAAKELLNIIQ